jgi:hypothetical protein
VIPARLPSVRAPSSSLATGLAVLRPFPTHRRHPPPGIPPVTSSRRRPGVSGGIFVQLSVWLLQVEETVTECLVFYGTDGRPKFRDSPGARRKTGRRSDHHPWVMSPATRRSAAIRVPLLVSRHASRFACDAAAREAVVLPQWASTEVACRGRPAQRWSSWA